MIETISQPFTNVQLELLKTFTYNVDDQDLQELRQLLAHFFANRAVTAADKAWDKNGWTDADVDRLLNTKLRKTSIQ